MKYQLTTLLSILLLGVIMPVFSQQKWSDRQVQRIKNEAATNIGDQQKMAQVMVDKVFSFAELGFQEFATTEYLSGILAQNGFQIEKSVSGIPTAFIARWGSGGPVIALGSDVDCIPKASQKPGVAYKSPIIDGAPGHGEGHNSGVPLNILAALEVKSIMEKNNIPGTLMLWVGIAEELLGTKAYYVRDGYFDDVDLCIFTHVSSNFAVAYGQPRGTGLVSVEFTFEGEAAHSAGAPWRGRSALDAVELTSVGWQYQREHLDPLQRSHHIINDGGDQPNVVPSKASIWFFIREITYPKILENYQRITEIAEGAAMMTRTTMTKKVLGSAWPRHFNKVLAERAYSNIQSVGLPQWSEEDQLLAVSLQKEINSPVTSGMAVELAAFQEPDGRSYSGGSDDIGDISWKVPTITLRYPANIPGLPGHHWSDAVAMATPIAHKGVVAGAQAAAMTMLDFLLKPELVAQAWEYYHNEQLKNQQYIPLISETDQPAIELNSDRMEAYRKRLEEYYYNEEKFDSYLEQLGVSYPQVKEE